MTKSAYAQRRGVSPPMVSKWIKAGRVKLTADGRLVDVAASDPVLAATLDPSRGGKNGKSTRGPVKRRRGRPPGKRSAKDLPHYDREKTRREGYNAETARTRYLKEIEELVPRAVAHKAACDMILTVRRVFEDIPPRYGAQGAEKLNVEPRVMIIWLEGVIFEALNTVATDMVSLAKTYEGNRWVDEKTRQEVDAWVADSAKLLRDWKRQNDPVPRPNGDARDGRASGAPDTGDVHGVGRGNEAARR